MLMMVSACQCSLQEGLRSSPLLTAAAKLAETEVGDGTF